MIKKTDIVAEDYFLISLCRLEFTDSMKEFIGNSILTIKDWDYVCYMANWHGIAALVYYNLERFGLLEIIPPKNREYLKGRLLMSVTRNAFNTESIVKTLKLLDREGIKTVLIKGMSLELSVYGNRGLRQMSDADVLMTKDDCIRAKNILSVNGYGSLPVKSWFHKLIYTDVGKHLPSLIKEGFSFELHHELFRRGDGTSTMWLYNTSKVIFINGEQAYIPSPLAGFIYLVRHLSLHETKNESQLRLYTDLAVLLDKFPDEILNNDLIERSIKAGIADILACRLMILREFWHINFTDQINSFIEKYAKKEFIGIFLFFIKSPKDNKITDNAMLYRHQIGEVGGFSKKILFILGDLFPSLSFMKKRYNCGNKFNAIFYYPHRLGKLYYLIKKQRDKSV